MKIRRLIVCSGLILACAAPLAAGRSLFAARDGMTYDIPGAGLSRVIVENPVGRITVVGKHDATRVAVEVERSIIATAAGLEDEAASQLERFRILVERIDDVARVSVIAPPELPETLRATADLQLVVPSATDIVVRAADGAVRLVGLRGVTEVRTVGGDVDARRMSALDVFSESGDIDVRKIAGHLALRTVRGDVRIAHDANGTLEIDAADGDVALSLTGAAARAPAVHASSRSGSVKSEVPLLELAKFAASTLEPRIAVRTDRGHIRITRTLPPADAERNKRVLRRDGSGLQPGRGDSN